MHNQYQPAVSPPQFRHTAPADFRVIACYTDRSQALVSMADTRGQAIYLAKQYVAAVVRDCRKHKADTRGNRNRQRRYRGNRIDLRQRRENRIRAVFVEEWVGGTIEGSWRRLDSEDSGFDHLFGPKNGEGRDRLSLTSGVEVECVLLQKRRARAAGWLGSPNERSLAQSLTPSRSRNRPPQVKS